MFKKICVFILFSIIFSAAKVDAATLSGGVSSTDVLGEFYGTWHVTSKVVETNNPQIFNKMSVDIWQLSGYNNVLVLTNPESGATSSISIEDKNVNGKTLKFTRVKTERVGGEEIVYTEIPELTIDNRVFKGFDTYIVERYKNGVLYKKDTIKYKIVGQKMIGGDNLGGAF